MAVRAEMANIIERARLLVADQEETLVFTDQQVQDKLDMYRCFHRYERLRPDFTILPGGRRIWTEFYATQDDWEEDAALVDASYNPLTPDTSDFITGHWTFTDGLGNGVVFIVGQSYDLNSAGADLCDAWAAKLKGQFDFSDQNVSYKRSQQVDHLRELAADLRSKGIVQTAQIIRTDTAQSAPGFSNFSGTRY